MKQIVLVAVVSIFTLCLTSFQVCAAEPFLKNMGDGVCQDVRTGLTWQIGKSKTFKDEASARDYVKSLDLAGHTDWRFPTMKELKELLDIFDKKRNGDCSIKRLKSKFWVDASMHGTQAGKLAPNDECGGGYEFVEKKKGAVRGVRH